MSGCPIDLVENTHEQKAEMALKESAEGKHKEWAGKQTIKFFWDEDSIELSLRSTTYALGRKLGLYHSTLLLWLTSWL